MTNLKGASILPHPPIVVPEVGKDNVEKCQKTYDSCLEIAYDIQENNPELIIVITPHSQAYSDAFSVYTIRDLVLNFNQFGDSSIRIPFDNNIDFISELTENNDFTFAPYQFPAIDHGAGVPLYFLDKAGFKGEVCIINYSFESNDKLIAFGKHLKEAIEEFGKKTYLIASGDMSHRLLKEGPYGFKKEGVIFDEEVVCLIKEKRYKDLLSINPRIREDAGECGYNSLMVAMGAIEFNTLNNKFYSYEAPFGVGYLVASL